MSDDIDIKGLDKAALLAALFNRSKPLGLGFLEATPQDMTIERARHILNSGKLDFDYLEGRVMKVNLSGDMINSYAYDRDIGKGAAQSVVDALRSGQPVPKNKSNLTSDLETLIARAQPTKFTKNTISLGIDDDLLPFLEGRRADFRPGYTSNFSQKSAPAQNKERITLEMNIDDALLALSEGRPDSGFVLLNLAIITPKIDPNAMAIGGLDFMSLLHVDSLGLYGNKAAILYKICQGNIEKTAAIVRGWQLGLVSKEDIDKNIERMINTGENRLDVNAIILKVQERLPGYKKIVSEKEEDILAQFRATANEITTPSNAQPMVRLEPVKYVANDIQEPEGTEAATADIRLRDAKLFASRLIALGSVVAISVAAMTVITNTKQAQKAPVATQTTLSVKAKSSPNALAPKVGSTVSVENQNDFIQNAPSSTITTLSTVVLKEQASTGVIPANTVISTVIEIQQQITAGSFNQIPVVSGHNVKKELAQSLGQNDWIHTVARLADAGYSEFNNPHHTKASRLTGAQFYGVANELANLHNLHNPNAESVRKSVQWLMTTSYGSALNH